MRWCGRTANPGWVSNLTWAATRGLRFRVRCHRGGAVIGFAKAHGPRAGHNLHQTDGFGGAGRLRGGAAQLPGSDGSTRNAASKVSRALKRGIAEKKWAEAHGNGREAAPRRKSTGCQNARGRTARWLGALDKRLAARFYQTKTGRCCTGQRLNWTKSRPTPQFWWCRCRGLLADGGAARRY